MSITTGFITGTGFYSLPNLTDTRQEKITTPYREVEVEIGSAGGQEVAFIARHGKGHTIAPSAINYRANVYAMHMLGVERILATSVSGSLVLAWGPGTLILIDQLLNFTTSARKDTFYPMDGRLAHVDVTDPYCPTLHQHLAQQGRQLDLSLQKGATYACFDGPRYETRAEIDMVRRAGGHLVGQTNYPEAILARELAICYATIGIVSNYAAGMKATLTTTEVLDTVGTLGDTIGRLFEAVTLSLPAHYDCPCRHALDEAFIN